MVQEFVPGRRRGAVLLRCALRGRRRRSRASSRGARASTRRTSGAPARSSRPSTCRRDRRRRRCESSRPCAWTGLVEVEFKRDPGRPFKLLDVNPRVWGWHTLGAAGRSRLPVPALAARLRRAGASSTRARPAYAGFERRTDLPTVVVRAARAGGSRCASTCVRCAARGAARSSRATIRFPAVAELPLSCSILLRRLARGGGCLALRPPRPCGSWSSVTLAGIDSSTVETEALPFHRWAWLDALAAVLRLPAVRRPY